ncbi:MAG: hypothetical protein KDA37_06255, partial [Planctomycetales bacterium]|nr:hypothetical protein [Planctomycetales bacterium]
ELLVLDEPVASLDPNARREFLRTLIHLIEDPSRAVVFSTHITSDLERVATRLALLKEGRVSFCGELDTLKERVKRLKISSDAALPADFSLPGALTCEVDGRLATVTVADFAPELPDKIATEWRVRVQVIDLNLEEIFVELHANHHSTEQELQTTGVYQ